MTEISMPDPTEQETTQNGMNVIIEMVKRLPGSPGVYRMIDADENVLYVGKARNLKKRVTSYSRPVGHSSRIMRMIMATATMEFVTTQTEAEALLLEANLIKRLRPRYNVLLRDDKSFPYIHIDEAHSAPKIVKHRGARKGKGAYFGPFASAGAVNRTINALQKAFLIRSCSDGDYENRSRPCLLHQIKRCSGPCTGEIDREDYARLVEESKDFLSGRSARIKKLLGEEMETAAANLDFETAAVYRDRLSALSLIQGRQDINPQTIIDADIFAAHQAGGQTCIQVFFFRAGQNWGNHAFFPRADRSVPVEEVLSSFLTQFYDDKPCPKTVLTSHAVVETELLSLALSERAGHKVTINAPQRGEKKDLIAHALRNAEEALGRKLSNAGSQATLLDGVAKIFDLVSRPKRIEVYDNSHIMGTNPVGAMIVAGREGFEKAQYRKFNIKSVDITPGDDYGMMREVMTRRFSRLIKETGIPDFAVPPAQNEQADETDEPGESETANDDIALWPDLVIVDGGQGQLTAAREILKDLGLDQLPIAGIAKGPDRDAGREKFFMPGKQSFVLPERDPVLYFVQRLRDEAHRFAIGSHRARRKKEMIKNPLDEIEGIGPTRKRALLKSFGSAKAVSRAALEDLTKVSGISAELARVIYDHFHEN